MIKTRCYYMNHRGEMLNLVSKPYLLQTAELYDSSWEVNSIDLVDGGTRITGFYKKMKQLSLTLSITADTEEEYVSAVNRFHMMTEADVLNMNPGRLYVGGYYISCYVRDSEVSEWEYGIECQDRDITIVAENPMWVKDVSYEFNPSGMVEQFEELDLPYDLPYDLLPDSVYHNINNKFERACEFTMYIFGPAVEPIIYIGDHLYEVVATIYEGEYMVIDSAAGTVERVANDGTVVNLYNSRNKESSVFKKIDSGINLVTWNQTFSFRIDLHQERGEPELGI